MDKIKVCVVNDCAHVMEDLLPLLRKDFDINFIKRSRNIFSKTIGISFKILKSHGDLYHVSYALQDAWLVNKLKHLDILHIHGSDIRSTINSKKWGWLVKNNLKNAKVVLYSTPDLQTLVEEYRKDAMWLPTPIDVDKFKPKTSYSDKPKALYFKLWYEGIPVWLEESLKANGIQLTKLERNIPYERMPDTLRKYDIFIDRFTIPSFSKTCLEAMSCGLATIDWRHDFRRHDREQIEKLSDSGRVQTLGKVHRVYVEKHHDVEKVALKLLNIWMGVL